MKFLRSPAPPPTPIQHPVVVVVLGCTYILVNVGEWYPSEDDALSWEYMLPHPCVIIDSYHLHENEKEVSPMRVPPAPGRYPTHLRKREVRKPGLQRCRPHTPTQQTSHVRWRLKGWASMCTGRRRSLTQSKSTIGKAKHTQLTSRGDSIPRWWWWWWAHRQSPLTPPKGQRGPRQRAYAHLLS